MKKVLHIINGEFYAGAERVQDILAMRLPENGYLAYLACLKPGEFIKNCTSPKKLVHEFPMRSRIDLTQVKRIVHFVQENNIELLHTHTPRGALIGFMVAMRTGLPRIHHIHSPTSRDTENKWRNVINTLIERVSVIGVRRFIAVSESLGQLASATISPKRITVVPNGVQTQPQTDRSGRTPPLVVGSVALFRPRKGLEVLIHAFRLAQESGSDILLHIIGGFETTEYENAIKKLAVKLGVHDRIVWRGFQQDIPAELANLDVFVLPSLYGEGMPMVVLEAMAAGLPIVASDVEGLPQVLGRDGVVGRLAKPGDAESLAQNLLEILHMPEPARLNMGQTARQKHARLYSDVIMAKNVAAVYNAVLH